MLLVGWSRAGAACSAAKAPCWSESQLLDWRYLLLGRNQFQRELCNLELKDIRCIQGIIFPLQITGLSFKRFNIPERAWLLLLFFFFFFFFSFWKLPYWCSQNRDLEMRIMACTSHQPIHCSLQRGRRIMPDHKYLCIQQAVEWLGRVSDLNVWLAGGA